MTVDLLIAGRRIRLCSQEGIIIRPDERFSAFKVPSGVQPEMLVDTMPGALSLAEPGLIDTGIPYRIPLAGSDMPAGTVPDLLAEADLVVEVEPGAGEIPVSAVKVFDAQLMEEVPGGVVSSGEPFWEILRDDEATWARVFLKDPVRTALLVMPHGEKRWKIFTGEHQDGYGTGNPPAGHRAEYLSPGVYVQEDPVRDQQYDPVRNNQDDPVRDQQYDPVRNNQDDPVRDQQYDPVRHQQNRPGDDLPEPSFASGSANGQADDALSLNHPATDDFSEKTTSADDLIENPSSAESNGIILNPLPYPLDGLLLYFLFSRAGDIMIHGSGVSCHGRGWLFTGRSGSGKTTLARIFDHAGDRVIHDDRLVLHREGIRWVMYNTPVYRNDEPRSARLDHLWVIRHGSANVSEPVAGAEAAAMVIANCIQQNWDREAAVRLVAAAEELVLSVKVSRLSFLPDGTIRDYLRLRKEEDISLAAGAADVLLREGKNVTVTAGGYSMWPAIRPGDTVVIGSWDEGAAAAGQIVALRRDGGFVLHRITRVMIVSGHMLIVTCGDAAARADEPAGAEMIAGMVLSVSRSGRLIPPPRRRMPRWFNRITAIVAGWAERQPLI